MLRTILHNAAMNFMIILVMISLYFDIVELHQNSECQVFQINFLQFLVTVLLIRLVTQACPQFFFVEM